MVAYGAALLYNLMVAEKAAEVGLPVAEGLAEKRRKEMEAWAASATNLLPSLRSWSMQEFWQLTMSERHRISIGARRFVETLVAIVQGDPRLLADSAQARLMIHDRERALKGGLARLTNRPALERFAGEAGLAELTYRWPNVKLIVADIRRGLTRRDEPGRASVA
jgi:hypothetical protein